MTSGRWSAAALAATMMVLGAGCIIRTGGGNERYQNCTSGTVCVSGSTCLAGNVMAGSVPAGSFCTNTCSNASQCAADVLTGLPADCVIVAGSTTGQCYRRCEDGTPCGGGQMCTAYAPGIPNQICVPVGSGTVTCGGIGQNCCAGATPCTASGAVCNSGTCAAAPTCGGVGQMCCSGNTCTAPGSACASNGQCLLAPYSGCATTSIGQACAAGLSQAGTVINTTCQQAQSMGSTGAFCTATCTAAMTECPQVPSGEPAYNCYRIAGATTGQCFQDCDRGMACPPGTTCRMVTPVGVSGTVSICMP